MLKKSIVAASVALVLTGCASTSKKTVDTTPQNATMVFKADTYMNGLYLPEVNGKQVVYTRADQRRIDNDTKFSSFVMRWANSSKGQIARIDTKLSYMLDHDKKQYRECPLAGCTTLSLADLNQSTEDNEQYESYDALDCKVSMTRNDFTVNKTGQQRVISNAQAEEYKVDWQTVIQDGNAQKDTNIVQMTFWTTTPQAEMQKAWQINREFQKNYVENAEDNALVRLLGKEAYMAVAAISGDIENTDKKQYNRFMTEMAKIKGYPLSIKLEWFRDTQACQDKRSGNKKDTGVDLSGGLGAAAKSMLSGFVNQQKDKVLDEWRKKPMFHYLYDVTYIKEEQIHDSVFSPPAMYKLTDRQ